MTVRQAVSTVVAPVPDVGLGALRETVATIRLDPAGNDLVPFGRFDKVHFASLVLAEGLEPSSLLILELNADGTAASTLAALVAGAGPGLDALFASSDGWPGSADAAAAKAWLEHHVVRPGAYHIGATGRTHQRIRDETRLHEAIQAFLDDEEAAGRLVGVTPAALRSRVQEFVRGDASLAWARSSPPRLGDTGPSDPALWRWGGPGTPVIHVLVAVYAPDESELERELTDRRAAFVGGLAEVAPPIEGILQGGTEHFGFADGLSQPVLKGWPRRTTSVRPEAPPPPVKWEEVNPGEVILGYPDNYDKPAQGPTVAGKGQGGGGTARRTVGVGPSPPGPQRHLSRLPPADPGRRSLPPLCGCRQRSERRARRGAQPRAGGAKMVGRWPSGASVVVFPDADPGEAGTNDFGYHEQDQAGFKCPMGAHVRRSNPRDSSAESPAKSLVASKNHRVLRRGRPYGLPLADPPTRPGEEDGADRGLLFLCLNSDFERQFEFVQHTWVDNGFFAGLGREVDPLVGSQPEGGGGFTLPDLPVRRRLTGVPRFVTTVGGAYFFLPGIRALAYLAALEG